MANNRLWLCSVNDEGVIEYNLLLCKNMGGEWYTVDYLYDNPKEYIEKINDFLIESFISGNGISIKDEYMDVPLPPLHVYNGEYEGKGHWEFIKENDV